MKTLALALALLALGGLCPAQEPARPHGAAVRRVLVRHADPQLIWQLMSGQTTFGTAPEITTPQNTPQMGNGGFGNSGYGGGRAGGGR